MLLNPCLIILSGMPLTGKDYVAHKLQKLFSNLLHIDVDQIRKLYDFSSQSEKLNLEYEKDVMIQSYKTLCNKAEDTINNKFPVVITGTFSRSEFKKPLKNLLKKANEIDTSIKCFLLKATDNQVKRRINKRIKERSFSNIDSIEKYNWAKTLFEKIDFIPIIEIDTKENYYSKIIKEIKLLQK
jgi:predicted kinase